MERKRYSTDNPVPRQTVWNQKQKRLKSQAEAEGSQSEFQEMTDPFTSENNSQPSFPTDDFNHPVAVTENYEEGPSTSSMQEESCVPILKPRHILESDEEDCSSDDETPHVFCDFIDEPESSDEDDIQSLVTENETEGEVLPRLWFKEPEVKDARAADNEDVVPSCPPQVKYPLLVHLLRTKHHLTKAATEDVMEIINDFAVFCINETILPKDARTLQKKYEPFLSRADKHFLCFGCGTYVGKADKEDRYRCGNCDSTYLFKESEYFFYLPLRPQLRELFETEFEKMSVVFQQESESCASPFIRSTRDGAMYKESMRKTNNGEQQISMTFSCDGVPVFKSSRSSLWPVLCTINELPMGIRKRFVLTASLWYGTNKGKPDMNQFLYPFVRETTILYSKGFLYYQGGQERICKVKFQKSITDSVARPLLLDSNQFNGEYGCSACPHPGEQVAKGRGTVRVYPHLDLPPRTMEETKRHAKEAVLLTKKPFHVKGIKGETILSFIPDFDIVRGLIPDYMHCAILGTTRQFANMWFDSKHSSEHFYIGLSKDVINSRLRLFQPPSYVSRPTRCLEDMKFWKGHEWYWWALGYSSLVLKGILGARYLKHWLLFVEALFLLCQEVVMKSHVYNAMELFVQFTQGTQELYGLEYCSFNVHLNEHLGQYVLYWGPLYEQSAFLYEDYLQVLLNCVHSSKGVLDQVVDQIRTMRSIPVLLSTPAGEAVSGLGVCENTRLLSTKDSVLCDNAFCDVTVLSPSFESIPYVVRLAFASLKITVQPSQKFLCSQRIIVNQEVFQSKSYTLVKRRNNFTVVLTGGRIFAVEKYFIVGKLCYAVGRYLPIAKNFKLFTDRSALTFQVFVRKESQPVSVVDVKQFVSKVFFLKCDHLSADVACLPPNKLEIVK